MEKNKQLTEDKETIVIENTNNVIGWLEKFLKLLKEYGPIKILISTFLIAFISIFFYFMFNPIKIFEVYDKWRERQHEVLMELRMDMAPQIQSVVDKLTYKVGASRTLILEMHNGSVGNGGLPFTKCTATYEGLNINVYPVANQYQEQNLSLIPFATYLFKQGYWRGDTDELLEIDKALYYKMKGNETEHFAACVIDGVNQSLAFMIISFNQTPDEQHDCDYIREYIRHAAMEVAVLLEVGHRMEGINYDKL